MVLPCVLLVLGLVAIGPTTGLSRPIAKTIHLLIRGLLIDTDPIPPQMKADAIYVMGGSQHSLESRFRKAADLYHKRISDSVLILSRPGITQYSHRLRRNLTNDEWSLFRLQQLGVPRRSVEAIPIKGGIFGTLREAKAISRLIEKRGYKQSIVVSSPCHTRRVKASFEKFLTPENVRFFVQASDGKSSFMGLVSEFIKLKVYQALLLS